MFTQHDKQNRYNRFVQLVKKMRNKILHKFFVRSFKSFKQPRRLQNGIPFEDKRTCLLGKS